MKLIGTAGMHHMVSPASVQDDSAADTIALTVLLATYNRADILADTLNDLANITQPQQKWELIVVDNNSTDHTRWVCRRYADRLPLVYIHEPRQGKSYAINTGIDSAHGELVAITDDDVSPCKNWLNELIQGAARYPDIQVFGQCLRDRFIDPPQWFHPISDGMLLFGRSDHGPVDKYYEDTVVPAGAAMMIRRSALLETGIRYDCSMGPNGRSRIEGEDRKFLYEFLQAGYPIVYLANARLEHRTYPGQMTLPRLRHRAYNMGRGYARFDETSRTVLGVPLWLYRRLVERSLSLLMGGKSLVDRTRLELALGRDFGFASEKFRMFITRQTICDKPPVPDKKPLAEVSACPQEDHQVVAV